MLLISHLVLFILSLSLFLCFLYSLSAVAVSSFVVVVPSLPLLHVCGWCSVVFYDFEKYYRPNQSLLFLAAWDAATRGVGVGRGVGGTKRVVFISTNDKQKKICCAAELFGRHSERRDLKQTEFDRMDRMNRNRIGL